MRLRTSWRNIVAWWDHLFEASDFGLVRRFCRRKPVRRKPMFRRPDLTFDMLERREVPAVLTGITEFSITSSNSGPRGITAGPDGNIWFVENATNKIAKITPTGTVTEYKAGDSLEIMTVDNAKKGFDLNEKDWVVNVAPGIRVGSRVRVVEDKTEGRKALTVTLEM